MRETNDLNDTFKRINREKRDCTLKGRGLVKRETRGSVMCQRTVQCVQGQAENELPEGSRESKEQRAGQRERQEPEEEGKKGGRRSSEGAYRKFNVGQK